MPCTSSSALRWASMRLIYLRLSAGLPCQAFIAVAMCLLLKIILVPTSGGGISSRQALNIIFRFLLRLIRAKPLVRSQRLVHMYPPCLGNRVANDLQNRGPIEARHAHPPASNLQRLSETLPPTQMKFAVRFSN